MKKAFISLFLSMVCLLGKADWADNFKFAYYGIAEGLCDEYAISTYEDNDGYIWICTSNGLDRFDGHRFVHFSSQSENQNTRIKNSFIYGIVDDDLGGLWVVSNNGLLKIDKKNESILFPYNMGDFGYALSEAMIGIVKGNSNDLLILKREGIMRIELDQDGNISKVRASGTKLFGNRIMTLTGNILYIGGLNGIEGYRISTNGEMSPLERSVLDPISGIKDVSYLLANGDQLWIGTENGLYHYDTKTNEISTFRHENNNPQSISDDHITCMAFGTSGDLMIGTTKGIDLYSRTGRFSHMTQGRRNHSLNTDYVNNIFVDKGGTIWVSTLVGGINKLSPKEIDITDIFSVEEGKTNVISCSFEDKDGNILVGILGKGLGIKYKSDGEEKIFSLKDNAGVSQEDIFTILQDKDGDFWFGTRYDGFIHMSGSTLDKPSFRVYSTRNSGISDDHIFDMVYDDERHGIWFCSSDSIYYFDIESKTSEKVRLSLVEGDYQPSRFHCLYVDKEGRLWAGGYGLCIIDISEFNHDLPCKTTFYRHLGTNVNEDLERINSITQTDDGVIFVGSNSNGFYQMLPDGTCRNWPLTNSLAENSLPARISKIIPDEDGNLWVGAVTGVFHANRATGNLVRFTTYDGFPSHNCYINSGNRMSGNRIAFGTSNGLIIIQSPYTSIEDHVRKVHITNVITSRGMEIWSGADGIDIYPGESSFEIDFSAMEMDDTDRIWYAYRLDEISSDYTYTTSGKVTYNNLKPGKYTFRVLCTYNDNTWSEEMTLVHIHVHPEFTETVIFWILIMGTILALLAGLVISKFRDRSRQRRELQKQVEEKTADLKAAIEKITESKDSIERQNLMLEEQKAKLEEYAASVDKAHKEKLMIYTNLTHEFKTPLSLILGPVSEMKDSCKDTSILPSLGVIERNSKYLLALVNQILDLRRVDSGQIKIRKDVLHIPSFLSIFATDFSRALSARDIRFETNFHLYSNSILSDRDILFKIISNLISNAAKYTPDGGRVTFNLAQFRRKEDNRLFQYISVTNTGSYISAEESEIIFDCFYKSKTRPIFGDSSQGSTGIGLYLVRNLVIALGGQITVKSNEKSGTSFRLYFPVDIVTEENAGAFSEPEKTNLDVPSLLIVEDNDDMRNYIKSILIDRFNVLEASNGEQGYEIAKKAIPDFIISDLMMPVCDGFAFCKMIREDSMLSHIPFLMLTALSDDDTRLNSYKQGVSAFLVKPFKKDMLLARIENIMNDKKQQQEELTYDLENSYATVNIDRSDKAFMEQLMQILKDNYTDPELSVPKIQTMMCMSLTPFYKKVSSLTGLTPAMLLRHYRLQTAKSLLEKNVDKRINVSEIAYMVGFNDPKYFSKCFQKEYHIKPSSLLQDNQDDTDSDNAL